MPIHPFEKHKPQLAGSVYVADSAVVIGDAIIGEHSSIWPQVSVRADVNSIRIGESCNIQDNTVVHVTPASPYHPDGFMTTIGSEVTIGHTSVIHGCTIADHCLIGMGCCIMDGAIVEAQVVVGGGSLIPPGKVLESGYLYFGRPAVRVRKLTEQELEEITYSAQYYVELAGRY